MLRFHSRLRSLFVLLKQRFRNNWNLNISFSFGTGDENFQGGPRESYKMLCCGITEKARILEIEGLSLPFLPGVPVSSRALSV